MSGWIGTSSQLMHVLDCYGCDKDSDGKFCVSGGIVSFWGMGDEYCVSEDAKYYVGGEPRSLIAALSSTSYGLQVTVI